MLHNMKWTVRWMMAALVLVALTGHLSGQTWSKVTGPNDSGTDWWNTTGSSNAAYGISTSSIFTLPNPGATGQYLDADQSGACYQTWRSGFDDAVFYDGLNSSTPPLAIFTWNGSGWDQQTGKVNRNAASVQRSVFLTNVGGLSFTAAFNGGSTTYTGSGQADVQDAVFFTSQRCQTGSTEFGAFREVNGTSADNTLFFYWGLNMNCPALGQHTWYCATSTDGGSTYTQVKTQTNYSYFQLPIPSGTNSGATHEWRYYMWLTGSWGAYTWNFKVVDPYDGTLKACDMNGDTSGAGCTTSATPNGSFDAFNSFAQAMLNTANNGALGGNIVVTSLNDNINSYYSGANPPQMVVSYVWVPAY